MNIKRREGYFKVTEDFVEKEIILSPEAMKRFWETLLPEAIEIIKKEKQQNNEKTS